MANVFIVFKLIDCDSRGLINCAFNLPEKKEKRKVSENALKIVCFYLKLIIKYSQKLYEIENMC